MNEAQPQAKANRARAELGEALAAIEEKLDVRKQASRWAKKVEASYRENPVPWIIGATAAGILVVGTVVWALVSDD